MRLLQNFLLTTVTLLAVAASAPAQSALTIPEADFDFGRTSQHAVVSHRFWIHSTGAKPLEITHVVPGCGCTKAPLKDSVVAPGDSTYLDLYFSTKSYRGFVKKRPYLETSQDEIKHYMMISAELLPLPDTVQPVHLSPSRLDVSQFRPKVRRKASFWIVNTDTVDYRVKYVDHADYVFDLNLPEKVAAGDSAKGSVSVLDEYIETDFEHSLTFELDDADRTRYTLPVQRMYRVKESAGK